MIANGDQMARVVHGQRKEGWYEEEIVGQHGERRRDERGPPTSQSEAVTMMIRTYIITRSGKARRSRQTVPAAVNVATRTTVHRYPRQAAGLRSSSPDPPAARLRGRLIIGAVAALPEGAMSLIVEENLFAVFHRQNAPKGQFAATHLSKLFEVAMVVPHVSAQ